MILERVVPKAEIQRAEARLTPKQRAMSRIRARILAPLEGMGLPKEQVEVIQDYAEEATERARAEFEQLQKESPANRILEALEKNLARLPEGDWQRERHERVMTQLHLNLATWQTRIAEAQSIAFVQGESKSEEELIRALIEAGRESGIIGAGMNPELISIANSSVGEEGVDLVLRDLGFLPEGVSSNSFFSIAMTEVWLRSFEEKEKLMWSGKPRRIKFGIVGVTQVIGLTSETLPGVAVVLERWRTDQEEATFHFNTEAIAKSTATIPAVVA